MEEICYPKILICSLNRINCNDTASNSLLLKNLLSSWPREKLAQVYSGGSNGDEGFCGSQYHIGPHDRRLGNLFFKLKGTYSDSAVADFSKEGSSPGAQTTSFLARWKRRAGRYFIYSGLYELVFKLCPSRRLIEWAEAFDPDIIFAQGYSLAFIELPIFFKKKLNKPLAFYTSDDWPSALYVTKNGPESITSPLLQWIVGKSTRHLLSITDAPFAFNVMMGDEYRRRYGKSFTLLMNGDDPERFNRAEPIRFQSPEIKSIVAAGSFDDSRWPLLIDLAEACSQLNSNGLQVHIHVITPYVSAEGYRKLKACQLISLHEDPGHELLPSYLKGADLLFLSETFDPVIANERRYSVSTKAHLFMYSGRPILAYGASVNGVIQYAEYEKWAAVLDERDIGKLKDMTYRLLTDSGFQRELVLKSEDVAHRNHNLYNNQNIFRMGLIDACAKA